MNIESCNCVVCAKEYSSVELQNVIQSNINSSRFKICQNCLNISDPSDDYRVARDIINSYLKYSEAKYLFNEASEILDLIKK